MELLSGALPPQADGDDALRARWSEYVQTLKETDPEEYAALLAEMEQANKAPEVATSAPDAADSEFSPKLPGGTHVLGNDGVEQRPEASLVFFALAQCFALAQLLTVFVCFERRPWR